MMPPPGVGASPGPQGPPPPGNPQGAAPGANLPAALAAIEALKKGKLKGRGKAKDRHKAKRSK